MSSVAFEERGAYQSLQMVLQSTFGVVIADERQQSIVAKLKPLLSEFSLASLNDLAEELQKEQSGDLRNSVLQAITTHEDAWFEPKELFALLDGYLMPDMLDTGRKKYRIWVIGSGAGQLPYSLAMRIQDAMQEKGSSVKISIEATDISNTVVEQSAKGLYEETSMKGMDAGSRKKYMNEQSGQWMVNDVIRSMVSFSTCNLLDDFEDKGYFDLIICLDVLVYFSLPIKNSLLDSFAQLLDPSGILIPGVNDPVLPMNENFERVQHEAGTFYRQKS